MMSVRRNTDQVIVIASYQAGVKARRLSGYR
ncbi:hypothetical protein SPO3050 [Ruegeria pomeroyi DSS-3]|uniref:Uncharacterized protein n=1 Tax=Ruegeria pomeroyi (strain ATCC 700808 / DSM 15171 / DSS-3) TaxID=246200 RepID=Q5LP02_RUEPO|nr:hypothetical protein SPO3050 [Ruegeria pomeroyi DSS-3]